MPMSHVLIGNFRTNLNFNQGSKNPVSKRSKENLSLEFFNTMRSNMLLIKCKHAVDEGE